jgi:hypothetical protein
MKYPDITANACIAKCRRQIVKLIGVREFIGCAVRVRRYQHYQNSAVAGHWHGLASVVVVNGIRGGVA